MSTAQSSSSRTAKEGKKDPVSTTASAQVEEQGSKARLINETQEPSDETMPADSHSFSRRSSAWDAASTSTDSTLLKGSEAYSSRKSSLSKAIDKAKSKFGKHGEALADDEEDYERQKAKAEKKQKRREEYDQLGLDERVKFGTTGAGGFNSA